MSMVIDLLIEDSELLDERNNREFSTIPPLFLNIIILYINVKH